MGTRLSTTTVTDVTMTQRLHSTLTVTAAGVYTSTVANSAFSPSADITLQDYDTYCIWLTLASLLSVPLCAGTSPPNDVEAVQHGLTSVIVTWTASSDATG